MGVRPLHTAAGTQEAQGTPDSRGVSGMHCWTTALRRVARAKTSSSVSGQSGRFWFEALAAGAKWCNGTCTSSSVGSLCTSSSPLVAATASPSWLQPRKQPNIGIVWSLGVGAWNLAEGSCWVLGCWNAFWQISPCKVCTLAHVQSQGTLSLDQSHEDGSKSSFVAQPGLSGARLRMYYCRPASVARDPLACCLQLSSKPLERDLVSRPSVWPEQNNGQLRYQQAAQILLLPCMLSPYLSLQLSVKPLRLTGSRLGSGS